MTALKDILLETNISFSPDGIRIINMDKSYSGIYDRLIDSKGDIFGFVNIYVNVEDVKYLEGLGTKLSRNDEITIVPSVACG